MRHTNHEHFDEPPRRRKCGRLQQEEGIAQLLSALLHAGSDRPSVGLPASLGQLHERRRMIVAEDRFRGFAVASWAHALHRRVFVDGEPGRINAQLNEVSDGHMLLEHSLRDLKSLAVRLVHHDAIHQLVTIGKSLLLQAVQ